ncbi:diol dehydratase reactivase ATPase-like domain-containing protein [Mycolicibacterium sediminis]|uniref:Diol dehydratase reactivation protein n=1 Tax=Mycolicibacterium sediminis TaxID=1286180 RepID=A0A7I7QMG6_9MYCO|nr:diol dehydratase reactivase ATPase-like domain-containing protein [Mycolicibacterium sediminis]BBY27482.1 diol dehydratase reactivation protein [Mycolicibacterium sediminis]
MTLVGGIDVGNHTTEIVLAESSNGHVRMLAHGNAHTRDRKGSYDSLEGATALLHKMEVEHDLRVDELLLSELRPVDTATTPISITAPTHAPLRSMRHRHASTPAGSGVAVGRHVTLAALVQPVWHDQVVVSVPSGTDFDYAASAITAALAREWQIVGVLVADDDAVLIHNRIPIDLPIVDEVDLTGLAMGACVAVEVVERGRAYRALTDPIALSATFGLPHEVLSDVARFARELSDAPALAITLDERPAQPQSTSIDFADVYTGGRLIRYPVAEAADLLHTAPVGSVAYVKLNTMPSASAGLSVDDAYFTSLAAIDDGSWLRRGTVDTRGSVVALLATDVVSDAATTVATLTGRPTRTVAGEPRAAAAGALTTPGVPPGTMVCDIGGGTVDLIADDTVVTAAGAGESITSAVAAVLGIPRALAERVKRSPAILVEGPHIAHEEDGRREFLPTPAAADTIGRLCTRGTAGLVPFVHSLAPEEWRSLRLAIKQQTVAANIARCLRSFGNQPAALLLAGGGALDDELMRTVGELMRATGVVVGRANVDSIHGPRYAVASGLVHLDACSRSQSTTHEAEASS